MKGHSATVSHFLERVKQFWCFGAQHKLVLALLNSSTRSVCSNEFFYQEIITAFGCIKFLGDFHHFLIFQTFQSFSCVFMASELGATICLIGWHSSHKILLASNLHASHLNGNCHGYLCAAWSIREIRVGPNLSLLWLGSLHDSLSLWHWSLSSLSFT